MKKILTLILLSMIAFNAIHADIKWNISADIKWNISIDGTLTISAHFSGFMPDYYNHRDDYKYSYNPAPWYSQRDKIKIVIIKNGVSKIGDFAFENCSSLTSVTIPNSMTKIGKSAFSSSI